ncbi:hypothetical protein CKO_03471 [Citrobacter koseri ATCC BAA-895]|uniref:Uncharacterized protein n=1 Tax=Citrobacter koseri (strain ATCC BAA-895 / CDC 4225-83 / SGSC4696) TaxID=290338 RepID=A8AM38_CITK8|nr:hypothetical protein CKO_03471 [Citrobacter koseri ATCC BAA-895]
MSDIFSPINPEEALCLNSIYLRRNCSKKQKLKKNNNKSATGS